MTTTEDYTTYQQQQMQTASNVISKSSLPGSQNAATTIDDHSTNNQKLSKLEEVLRRQRERLEPNNYGRGNEQQQMNLEEQKQRSMGQQ